MTEKRKRNFRKEYLDYHAKPTQKKERAARNAARAEMAKKGKVRKGDGMDVDHIDSDPLNNNPSNWRVQPKSKNRARNKHGRNR